MIPLANRLKEKRKSKNLSQMEIAKIVNIKQGTYSGYESGKHEPSLDILVKLANEYETSTDYLLGRYNRE